jgi:hypothetical protein
MSRLYTLKNFILYVMRTILFENVQAPSGKYGCKLYDAKLQRRTGHSGNAAITVRLFFENARLFFLRMRFKDILKRN